LNALKWPTRIVFSEVLLHQSTDTATHRAKGEIMLVLVEAPTATSLKQVLFLIRLYIINLKLFIPAPQNLAAAAILASAGEK